MTAVVSLTYAAAGLLVALVAYKQIVARRRAARGLSARLNRLEFAGGSVGVGALAMAAGTLSLVDGSTRGSTITGICLLLGGLMFVGLGTYAAWWWPGPRSDTQSTASR